MKRLICLLLLITILLCTASCVGTSRAITDTILSMDSSADSSADTEFIELGDTTTAPSFPSSSKKEENTVAVKKDRPNITSIKRTSVNSWREIGFSFKDSLRAIAIDVPESWKLSQSSPTTYRILNGDKEIGTITTELLKNVKELTELTKTTASAITTKHEIHLVETETEYIYRHSFTFVMEYGSKNYVARLQVDYGELDDKAAVHIVDSVSKVDHREGNLKIPLKNSNGQNRILIIGNSFVNTSDIGNFLKNFIASSRRSTSVHTSVTNGAVMRKYVTEDILSPIRKGNYSVVFLCGLYYEEDIPVIDTFLKACETGGAVLVVFPAHNERETPIATAKNRYPNVIFLDWKQEVTDIINAGADYWEFCEDDAYHHSKPPAGYIGAHMIFMALYDEVPAEYTGTRITMTKIRRLVGDEYIKTGFTKSERKITIYPLEQ